MSEAVTQEYISRKLDQVLDEVRRVRADNLLVLEALGLLQKTTVNLDRRLSDVKDELEMTIKIEVGGRLAAAESRIENHSKEQVSAVLDILSKMFAPDNLTSFEARAGKKVVDEEIHLIDQS